MHEKENINGEEHPGCLKNFSFYFSEYCDSASIHGLKFLGERKRSIVEKIWWLLFVGVSLFFCVSLILETHYKWMHAPVMVSFATSETEIWKIPFPAVTVCPLIQAEKSQFNLTDIRDRIEGNLEISPEESLKFSHMSLVCPKIKDTALQIHANDTVEDSINEFLINVSPSMVNITNKCRWTGTDQTYQVEEMFTPILTSGGVCYSFNMLDRDKIYTKDASLNYFARLSINRQPESHWTMEGGFEKASGLSTFPRRTLLTGTNGGLELILHTTGDDIDYDCRDIAQGYKVILHRPDEVPRYHMRYFWVPLDETVTVSVTPNMMTTSTDLKPYSPNDRKCYFIGEKFLRFFRIYNQQNCLLECLSNFTYMQCDCVSFYMPRDNSTPICGPAKVWCLQEAIVNFFARETTFQMERLERRRLMLSKPPKEAKVECRCLPSCFSLHYNAETSQLNWDWRKERVFNALYENKTAHLSRLRIFFKDMQFMTSERNELYGATEFWANCGGLLGLFTGFSFISLVEIVYFATLRFFCNVRRYGWRYWSGAEELLEVKVHK